MGQRWELPEPLATCTIDATDGIRISVRRHGNPDGPRLVVSHGNGLAVDAYYSPGTATPTAYRHRANRRLYR